MKRKPDAITPPPTLKFNEACRFNEIEDKLPYGHSPVLETYATFLENSKLAINMAALPGFYVFTAEKWILAQIQTNADLFGGRPAITPEEKRMSAFREKKLFLQGVKIGGDAMKEEMKKRTHLFQELVDACDPEVQDIVYGQLKSMVILGWTAFEVLLADLARRIQKSHQTKVPQQKFSFTRRYPFRTAYETIFSDPEIDLILGSEIIDAVALLRNVLVHANGIADGMFMSVKPEERAYPQNAILQALFPNLKETEKVQLNGIIVRDLLERLFKQGGKLAVAVDEWVYNNK